MMATISVIMPVFNTEKYVGETIESIERQTYSDWELIVVDDGSTDSSGRIADEYAGKNRKIRVVHTENRGPASARNRGIEESSAPLVCFIDSDDVYAPRALEHLVRVFEATGADIVAGNIVGSEKFRPTERYRTKVYEPSAALAQMLYQKSINNSLAAKLFVRRLFEESRLTDGVLYEDLDMMCRLMLKAKKIAQTTAPLYFYRPRAGSILHSWNARRLDVLDITEGIEHLVERHFPELEAAANDRRFSANFNMFCLAAIHGEKDAADRCWKIIREYRRQTILNPRVRMKNKMGALMSYIGRGFTARLGKLVYR